MTIDEYVKPPNIADAYALLQDGKDPAIVGGGAFMRLSSRHLGLAIDLCRAGLDYIHDTGNTIEIGAMTTIGELESSELLKTQIDGIVPRTVTNIASLQLRNIITVGGTVSGRYGFSELLTCLSILDSKVVLFQSGETAFNDYLSAKGTGKDIIEKIVIKKEEIKASYQPFRNTYGSLPILSVAVSRVGETRRIAVGARPGPAKRAEEAEKFLHSNAFNAEMMEKAGEIASKELDFSDDRKASADYRRELCRVLVKRALMEVAG